MVKRVPLEMAWQSRKKVVTAAIRMKHVLAADAEINEVLPAMEKEFWNNVQRGRALPLLDPMWAIQAPLRSGSKAS